MTQEYDSIEGMTVDEIRAAIAERDRQRDPDRGHAIIDYIIQYWPDDLAGGLRALLIGSPDAMRSVPKGSAEPLWSVKARQLDLLSFLLNRLITKLEESDLYAAWTSGGPDFDRDVARVLWQLDESEDLPAGLDAVPAKVVALAQVIHHFLEISRYQQNDEGGYHHAYPGAMISCSHDALKLLRSGKARWIGFIHPLLEEKTFQGEDPTEFLGKVWDALRDGIDDDLHLYFKDADSWTAYNLRFGFGTLRDAVVAALERAARRTGLFAVFGSRPEHWLNGILQALEEGEKMPIEEEERSLLYEILTTLAPTWQFSRASSSIDRSVSEISREGMISLGEALFSEGEDLPAFGKAVAYQGKTLQEAIDVVLGTFVSGAGIAHPEGRLGFATGVAVFAESFNAVLMDRFLAFDSPPGRTAEMLRQFLKLNATYWLSETTRRAALTSLSAYLGHSLKTAFADIDSDFKATLSHHYGVSAADWEAIRAMMGVVRTEEPLLKRTVDAAGDKLDLWLWDRLVLTMLPPAEPDHARFGQGATDFTGEGEFLRFLAQYRDFRAPFLPRPNLTVELREADRAMYQAMAIGDGLPALSGLLVWTVLFARLNRFGFDVLEGEAPAIGKDEWPWLAAAKVSGALGFCADILFGHSIGSKTMFLSTLPEIDHPSLASALRLWRWAHDGDDVRAALATWADKEGDADALDTLQLTRQALNYALLHQLQDMVSPGYLPRAVKDMEARAAHAYWRVPGSEDPSDGGGSLN